MLKGITEKDASILIMKTPSNVRAGVVRNIRIDVA